MREGTHFTVDVLPEWSTKRKQALQNMFVDLVTFLVALVFLIWGHSFVASSLLQESEMAGMPMVLIYIAWPVAGVSWTLFLIEKTSDNIKMFRSES